MKCKRVRFEVYCLAEDATAVQESFHEFFAGHDVGLWSPGPAKIDDGTAEGRKGRRDLEHDDAAALRA